MNIKYGVKSIHFYLCVSWEGYTEFESQVEKYTFTLFRSSTFLLMRSFKLSFRCLQTKKLVVT